MRVHSRDFVRVLRALPVADSQGIFEIPCRWDDAGSQLLVDLNVTLDPESPQLSPGDLSSE